MVKDHDLTLRTKADVTFKTVVRRILKQWDQATPIIVGQGHDWYSTAHEIAVDLAHQAGITIECSAAVLAHLSPRTTWQRNVMGAYAVVLKGDARTLMPANVERARLAMAAEHPLTTLNGPKTSRFARNIMGDYFPVTVDVWAAKIAGVSEKQLGRKGVYEAVEAAYQVAALKRGVDPAIMQAVTWIVARNGRAA